VTRDIYSAELDAQNEDVLRLGSRGVEAVDLAVRGLTDQDRALANSVIAGDADLDEIAYRIERRAISLIVRQAPVAQDARFVHATIVLSVGLERVGDLAVSIAKIAKRLSPEVPDPDIAGRLRRIGLLVRDELHGALSAFASRDVEASRRVPMLDDTVDEHVRDLFDAVGASSPQDASHEWTSAAALAGRHLERIGDQAVNVARRTIFIVTGELPQPRQPVDDEEH
jgi:phosphate transport system protein